MFLSVNTARVLFLTVNQVVSALLAIIFWVSFSIYLLKEYCQLKYQGMTDLMEAYKVFTELAVQTTKGVIVPGVAWGQKST